MPIMTGIEACTLISQYLLEEEAEDKMQDKIKPLRLSDSSESRNPDLRNGSVPFIYALTSEMSEEAIMEMRRAGFKEICK